MAMTHEHEHVVAELVNVARDRGIRCVMQVGACDGWELMRIRAGTSCSAIGIEGDTACKPCSDDIEFYYAVIGATDYPTARFWKTPDGNGLSSTLPRSAEFDATVVELPQHRLDTFCGERGLHPDMLIVDVEGTGLDVLEGCGSLLDDLRVLYVECQTSTDRPGERLVKHVEQYLSVRGFSQVYGGPCYGAGSQANLMWVRP